jgi:hypothetical protein
MLTEKNSFIIISRYFPSIPLEGLWKTTKKFSQDSLGFNPGPPEYEAGVFAR